MPGSGGSFFLVAGGTGDHAVQGNYGRDALDNNHQGAEAQEKQDQGPAYEYLVGSATGGEGCAAGGKAEGNRAAYCSQSLFRVHGNLLFL